ncbi:3725_t:CDS:2, partial [Acaulospora colombiana]
YLNGILATNQPPSLINWNHIPLPELMLFVEKVTERAKIDYHTAIAALILLSRLKKMLPKGAHGEYGTCHRLFLSAILVASKSLSRNQHYSPDSLSDEELHCPFSGLLIDRESIPSSSPPSSTSSEEEEGVTGDLTISDAVNCKIAEISGIFSVQEVDEMEKDFLRLLGQQTTVNDDDVKTFVENHRHAMG